MSLPMTSGEEYEWINPKTKNFADLTMGNAYDVLGTMNDEDAEELGFEGGIDDLWDFVNQQYTITE
jgi:hypothetical protein